ncbi:Enoyl-CoA hydratase [Sulfitobacter noctilucicola]|uniref:Enoyl-CoA hydratase/carnithine racemase n=1 Tax=Sulfitobacter noctilucicola TaxID=1342301 RepID=A0A7W6MAR5_9RHOB|nr:crotonase/enoyl-CoA hydratase family protein [Sulfitobacter noctilucicola]KIN64057.1 Enoyl-CoA hydratase [Sulfitobacter noctilucicola]MBB4175411.1 enoyl-CoA hydratase/carnithine racemase [Sulfitobacter noctilucicola]
MTLPPTQDMVTTLDIDGDIATLTFNRPAKRNAMNKALIEALDAFFSKPPEGINAVILTGNGGHFCSGLDLSEHETRTPEATMQHSRDWHRITERMEFGGLPIVSALTGSVIGGGMEIATATHVRIAEPSVRFQLPEGRRGIFVGGGATVRVGRLLGPDRMREMMLTGRSYGADEALALGLTHYAVGEGEALPLARDLARKVADNAPFSNALMIESLARISDMSRADGFYAESLAAAMAQTTEGASEGLRAFLEKRPPNFRP